MTPSDQSAPNPEQLRQRLPGRYSWIDHAAKPRLQSVTSAGQSLYLILVLISNRHGLSYHGEASLRALTKLDQWQQRAARQTLIDAGLIAYARPMYQVLDLTPSPQSQTQPKAKSINARKTPTRESEITEEERASIVKTLRQFRHQLAKR